MSPESRGQGSKRAPPRESAPRRCAPTSDLRYGDWVASTTEAAASDGVTGTPTIFVDGKQLDGFQLADVQAAVEQAQG